MGQSLGRRHVALVIRAYGRIGTLHSFIPTPFLSFHISIMNENTMQATHCH